ncbi:DUF6077 domain-containing protein [Nocardioides pantholopis]|uniref:DUF6077 domain-containing protein n=1 Tax=Nocardioides pantholopis TaxID=2483798 RepID=UPI000F08440C|nr:DUF6077 domain-containing protein [Nocardioides pantholopis]
MIRRTVDAVLDSAVLSFALWTLLYCLGLPTQWSLWPSGWIWLVATLAILVWQVRRALRAPGRGAEPAAGPEPDLDPGLDSGDARPGSLASAARALLVVGLVAAAGALLGGLLWRPGLFWPTWLATVVAAASLACWAWISGRVELRRSAREAVGAGPGARADLTVLAVAAGVAVLSLFVHLGDTDDPYYMNRSVWIAEQGNAATRDTMFSPEVFNTPYGGGIPVASIEGLIGVLAHLLRLETGTVAYLLVTPVASALSVWALWRLVRAWAPRRQLLALLAAVAFLLLSGDSMLGNFWIVRIWQGKVLAVAILMPLIWAYLTDLAGTRDAGERRRLLLLLLAAGVAFFGLTPTAMVWAPLMFAAALLAAVVLRSRPLALGGGLMVLGPIVSGLAVVVFSSEVGGKDPVPLSAYDSFVRMLGDLAPMVALSLVALALAPALAARGAATALAAASVLAAVVVYAPGILGLVNLVTGSGPILWRMLYVAPVPVLVGLLVTLPWATPRAVRPALVRAVAVAGVAVVVLGLAFGGRPIWSHTGHGGPVTVEDGPVWKLDLEALDDVRALDERGMEGVVLLPPRRMKVMTMYTTEAFPVVPRDWFVGNIEEPAASRKARKLLSGVAAGKPPFPSARAVDKALDQLDVSLACTGETPYRDRVVELFEQAGYGPEEQVGSLTCLPREDRSDG